MLGPPPTVSNWSNVTVTPLVAEPPTAKDDAEDGIKYKATDDAMDAAAPREGGGADSRYQIRRWRFLTSGSSTYSAVAELFFGGIKYNV